MEPDLNNEAEVNNMFTSSDMQAIKRLVTFVLIDFALEPTALPQKENVSNR